MSNRTLLPRVALGGTKFPITTNTSLAPPTPTSMSASTNGSFNSTDISTMPKGALLARSTGAVSLLRPGLGKGLLPRSIPQKASSEPTFPKTPTPRRRTEKGKGYTQIPEEIGNEIEKAIAINVAYNKLCVFPQVFLRASALEELDLTGNLLTHEIPLEVSTQLPSLVILKLSLNPLKTIPEHLFSIQTLKELHLKRCSLTELPSIPTGITSNLRLLDMDDNELQTLPASIGRLTSLKILNVNGNKLESLPRSLSLLPLIEIRANKNKLRSLPLLPHAQFIDLSFNTKLDALGWIGEKEAMAEFPVKTLLLQGNSISNVPETFWKRYPYLETVDASFNKISSVPTITGASLEGVFIAGNKLTTISLSNHEGLPRLQSLDVSRNKLSKLPDLTPHSSLRILSAGYNPLQEIPNVLPQSIKELNLSGCNLADLPQDCNLNALEYAFLSQNQFKHRSTLKLLQDSTATLRFVDITFNSFKELPSRISNARAVGVEVQTDFDEGSNSELQQKQKNNSNSFIGIAKTTGRRPTMEDVIHISTNLIGDNSIDLFAILDGHGSDIIAKAASLTIKKYLKTNLPTHLNEARKCLEESLKEAAMEASKLSSEKLHGATALIVLFIRAGDKSPTTIHIANIGDTRAIMGSGNGITKRISVDHKPLLNEEYKRIINCGGWVTIEGRVLDTLAIARALGDVSLHPYVISEPSISTFQINDGSNDDEFIVMASDGVWDVISDDIAGEIVSESLNKSNNPTLAAIALRDAAFICGSSDNISVIIISLKQQQKELIIQDESTSESKSFSTTTTTTKHHHHHKHKHKHHTEDEQTTLSTIK